MCKILMSIKPKYSAKIFDGTKMFEFRRKISRQKVDKIIIYSSSPEKSVIGEVEVLEIISKPLNKLWQITKQFAGISYNDYKLYFSGCKMAYAYKLGRVKKYKTPKTLADFSVSFSPQSYVYV